MSGAVPHAGFIIASYGAMIAIVGGLALWLVVDHRRQATKLAAAEARGGRRRAAQD